VHPGEQLSLQYHNHRSEYWRVLKGAPLITIGSHDISAKAGDEFEVPEKTNHRIKAGEEEVEILEISLGEFDEDDIVRLEDKYGRIEHTE
jgi:mannose-6-phosphate isomerase